MLWAPTESGNEVVGLWRVLTLARARRGWVLNGDRDAAVLLPRGVVPWSAVYRRWSSPRGSMALRTLDIAGLEGLLVEVRDALAPLADADPQVQRDLAALEVMLADQRGRVPGAPRPEAPLAAAASAGAPDSATGRRRGRRRSEDAAGTRNGLAEVGAAPGTTGTGAAVAAADAAAGRRPAHAPPAAPGPGRLLLAHAGGPVRPRPPGEPPGRAGRPVGHRQDPPRPRGRRRAGRRQLPGGRPPRLARQRGPPRLPAAVPRLPVLVHGGVGVHPQRRHRSRRRRRRAADTPAVPPVSRRDEPGPARALPGRAAVEDGGARRAGLVPHRLGRFTGLPRPTPTPASRPTSPTRPTW